MDDLASRILLKVADIFGLDLDVATWSHIIGLGLIGCIILVNLKTVLAYVSKVWLHSHEARSFR